ncbi:MAG TPA: hypothetical protein PKV66_01260, partial [Candidatus Pelethenecus sp.]|nr:hypothetical protein [Candidatus Pelethenecus sp.]
ITETTIPVPVSKRILAIGITIAYLFGLNLITLLATELILLFHYIYILLSLLLLLIIFIITIYVIQVVSLHTFQIKKLYRGILFTTAYFILFTTGFILYLKLFSNFKIVYGILSFFIILFFYLYILCIGVLLGINLNHLNIKRQISTQNNIEEVK